MGRLGKPAGDQCHHSKDGVKNDPPMAQKKVTRWITKRARSSVTHHFGLALAISGGTFLRRKLIALHCRKGSTGMVVPIRRPRWTMPMDPTP